MTMFAYVALDAQQNTINGQVEQSDRAGVISALTNQGLRPISIKVITKSAAKNLSFLNSLLNPKKIKADQLVIMTRQLSAMVGAGVPLLRSLTSLEKHAETPILKETLNDVAKQIQAGSTLGDALARHPLSFNDTYVNMVRAGEAAGILDEILKRIALQQEKSATIRKKIRSAMAYPVVLLGIMTIAFFGLMLFVIPQIGKILTDLGGPNAKLPTITLIMLGISHLFTSYWYIIFPALAAGIIFITRYIRTPQGKLQLDTLVLKIPGIKTIVIKIAVSRFTRTFSALMGAGVAVLEALSVTGRAVGNKVFENILVEASKEVKNGKSLSSVIENEPLFPSIVAQMLAVGEETGQTDTVLVKVADFYDEEVDVAINSVSSIIEPVMIVFMGSMVGLIAASVMVPIASLAQNVQ
jgi:type IV pilus assembly protein PilC